MSIDFKINGREYKVDGTFGPDVSLNEFIRTVADLRGTKAMCHEGGCGACVVAVRAPQPPTNEVKIMAVNSCLVSVLSCHGWEVITVEGIGNRTIGYHEIQSRLAKFNGTQCGYCTPGWVMNMYCLYESKNKQLTSKEIENSFASNICRCTGYRPIADAFKSFAKDANTDILNKLTDLEDLGVFKPCGVKCYKKCSHKDKHCNVPGNGKNYRRNINDETWCIIENPKNKMFVVESETYKWYKVYTLDEVFKAMSNGNYRLVAGNTGQGVYHITQYPMNLIDIYNLNEIKGFQMDVNLILGAGMPLTEMMDIFLRLSQENEDFSYLKEFYNHMDLVAHIPVRNLGTIGGNLYLKHTHNEFQSDVFLLFEVVGGMITIAEGVNKRKTITLTEFLGTDMEGKVIINAMLPPLSQCCTVKTYKIMPRSQNAHAIVNAGFMMKFHRNSHLLENMTIVYGGISPKFIHATKTESVVVGKDPYTEETLRLALLTLSEELQPEEAPPEPSAAYRKMLAIALYYKAILNTCPNNKIDPKFRSGGNTIKRETSKGTQIFDTDKFLWPLNQPIPKIEALVQCGGEATFANDLPTQANEVFAAFVTADEKPGSVISEIDATDALKIPGVIAFYTAKDIPGKNTFTPTNVAFMTAEEDILCTGVVKYFGQPVGIIVGDREKTANKSAKLVKVKYSIIKSNNPLLTIHDVLNSPEKTKRVVNDRTMEPTEIGSDVKHVIKGQFNIGAQYHYYMEPQTCVVRPTEDGIEVYSATQWLDLTNNAIAQCLNVPVNSVNVIVRRVGGGYGGKISRSMQIACSAALVSHLLGKSCRFILPLETNMKVVGKRIPTCCDFEVGVNNDGEIQYLKNSFYQDNGNSSNETVSPMTVEHFKNCYDSRRWKVEANSVITDTPSNTWCRAPASTEGVAMIEYMMERIAQATGKDPIEVRLANMVKENNPLPEMINQFKIDAEYDKRLEETKEFNNQNRWRKRGIKLSPLTYDVIHFGNYNSIVSIYYGDGSVVIIHGGIEMGQGLNTKVAQVCAYTLKIPVDKVSIKPSTSFTSPNTMTTGGSIGSECVSFATMKACEILLKRLEPLKDGTSSWEELIQKAYQSGVDLQATYMYSSRPDELQTYQVYAVCIIEVEVDILTGNHEVRRIDLLEDVGRSLSPEIDVGQIEGALVMGLGYWTSEKLVYDNSTGELLTYRTWTYKPPGIKDIPADMRIYFRRNSKNEAGLLNSKATGEPAFCLTTTVIHALRAAVISARLDAGYPDDWLDIENPCTAENIFMAVGHKFEHFKLK
ncbi:xanthine dehydrogenase-like [Epargyreus clarus]|uniref:xanthine dehydrogenase-like n=1 Tax=Epargyreus clarus TaxID=520877 RepID=UPI003C2D0265